MSEPDAPPASSTGSVDAGGWLRHAREQAGLTIDMVAQQLKLAPRQVRAIEDGDYGELPGRTFVRGFVRNYARLLKLDPEAVVAALPGAEAAPALEGPAIGTTSRPMGELPAAHAPRGGSLARWLIPAALIALVALGAAYELTRPREAPRPEKTLAKPLPVEPAAPAPPASGPAGAPLPNPVTGTPPAPSGPAGAPTGTPLPNPVTGTTSPAESPRGDAAPSVTAATTPASAPVAAAPAETPASTTGAVDEPVLVIQYRAKAWTQVKDARGEVLLISDGEPGSSHTVRGRPPLDIIIGNASGASVSWRGQPFELAPHVRGNVARMRLQ